MLVGVTREFLESIEKKVIYQRPAWRVDNALVDMHRDSVLLLSDHSLFTHGIEMPLRTCFSSKNNCYPMCMWNSGVCSCCGRYVSFS